MYIAHFFFFFKSIEFKLNLTQGAGMPVPREQGCQQQDA